MLFLAESHIPNAGRGLFTDSLIKKGETITEYTGEIITWKEVERRKEEEGVEGYVFHITDKHCIDAYHHPEMLARYANDARGKTKVKTLKNNAEFNVKRKRVFIVATKDIKPNSEIFVDYGKEYWEFLG